MPTRRPRTAPPRKGHTPAERAARRDRALSLLAAGKGRREAAREAGVAYSTLKLWIANAREGDEL